jgi:hypothetical protein
VTNFKGKEEEKEQHVDMFPHLAEIHGTLPTIHAF